MYKVAFMKVLSQLKNVSIRNFTTLSFVFVLQAKYYERFYNEYS
jgi:hypothetical protein